MQVLCRLCDFQARKMWDKIQDSRGKDGGMGSVPCIYMYVKELPPWGAY